MAPNQGSQVAQESAPAVWPKRLRQPPSEDSIEFGHLPVVKRVARLPDACRGEDALAEVPDVEVPRQNIFFDMPTPDNMPPGDQPFDVYNKVEVFFAPHVAWRTVDMWVRDRDRDLEGHRVTLRDVKEAIAQHVLQEPGARITLMQDFGRDLVQYRLANLDHHFQPQFDGARIGVLFNSELRQNS
jgi:hypothetical protein